MFNKIRFWIGKAFFVPILLIALNLNGDNFWIGINVTPKDIDFSGIQNKLKQNLDKILTKSVVKNKFPRTPKNIGLGFQPVTRMHITFAEGTVMTNAEKKAISNVLKKINFKRIRNIKLKPHISILGPKANFLVFEIDPAKNANLYNLVKTVQARISRISRNVVVKKYNPIRLHLSLGIIYPPLAKLQGNIFKNTRNEILKLAATTNPNNAKKFPKLNKSLKNTQFKRFRFVVTPSNRYLTIAQKQHPKYIYGIYNLK